MGTESRGSKDYRTVAVMVQQLQAEVQRWQRGSPGNGGTAKAGVEEKLWQWRRSGSEGSRNNDNNRKIGNGSLQDQGS